MVERQRDHRKANYWSPTPKGSKNAGPGTIDVVVNARFCDPSGVDGLGTRATGGLAGARPPANVWDPSGVNIASLSCSARDPSQHVREIPRDLFDMSRSVELLSLLPGDDRIQPFAFAFKRLQGGDERF